METTTRICALRELIPATPIHPGEMIKDELQAQGIGFDTLIYADGDAPALLDRSGKKLWRWQDGALVCTLDYAGTPMDLPKEQYRAAVMQDGWLFLRAVPPEGTVYEAQIRKEHILALLTGRNESEVIVDPRHLEQIMESPEPGFDMQMT